MPDDEEENLYLGRDLEDYASPPSTSFNSRRPGREEVVRALLPDSATIKTYHPGGYSGAMGFVIYLDDYIWLIKEYYGSCNLCDGMLAASDKIKYGRSILRNAYCLESEEDAIEFLNNRIAQSDYGWRKIAPDMQEIIE